jgi:aminoglycoside phosphotransferase (APT) family kinase protein
MSSEPAEGRPVGTPTGVDVERVVPWLAERCDWLTPPLAWTRLPGGHSNLTYRVEDAAGHRFVLRRPPMGALLPTAHDMGREYRLIDALWPTPVPVPQPIAFCDDPASSCLTDRPFQPHGPSR